MAVRAPQTGKIILVGAFGRQLHSTSGERASRVLPDHDEDKITALPQQSDARSADWIADRTELVSISDLGHLIGTDPLGNAVTRLTIVVTQVGKVVAAYPAPQQPSLDKE